MTPISKKRLLPILATLFLPIALIIVVITLANLPSSEDQSDVRSPSVGAPSSPLGVWSDLPNFPIVDLGFSGGGAPTIGPLKLKRAVAVAYPPNGKVYILGGRHRPDGEDIGVRWIWEYDPGPGTLTQKSALLDSVNFGDRYLSTMAAGVLTDTSGPRIYVIGGISMDSITVPTVRVYDPNTDTATTLPSDNWPANPERVPGGYAVYNNKLYIFGGHAAKPSTQLFSDTWVFDPMGAIGSKWTQIPGADLAVPRAYIAGATLDGYIYAVGGDVVVSTTVTPVNNVERFNPANPGAGWQSMASLPYPRGDMGAWAYDTGTGYEISGRILVAGGGYPSPDTQAYIYSPATNSWAFFTEMLRPRRNYAYTQLNGILYAWGGYNVTRGVQDGSNDSMKYNAGAPPPSILTPTNTPIPSPTSCAAVQNYTYTITTGATVEPGTTMVPGTNCSTCIHLINLPFPVQLYGQTFTSAMVGSTGNMQLQSNSPFWINRCLPYNNFTYTLMPLWDDLVLSGSGSGVFTSISGSQPNRIFNVEWRVPGTLSVEVRLFEDSTDIEYIYGTLGSSSNATIGIQKDMSYYTQVSCNTAGITAGTKITFTTAPCGTPTSTVTGTPPTATRTFTPSNTPTRTKTPTITPTVCGNYGVSLSTNATIVPGTTFVPNSNCDDCSNPVALPFPFTFYGSVYNSLNAVSNGSLQFVSSDTAFTNVCLPDPNASYAVFPYWDDLLLTTGGDGIYTSISGTAPNRIFNIEWRGCYYASGICGGRVSFEARLYEAQTRIDVIYAIVGNGNTSATGGVQKDQALYLEAFCNGIGIPLSPNVMLTYTLPSCSSPTPGTPASTVTPTPSATRTITVSPSATAYANLVPGAIPGSSCQGGSYAQISTFVEPSVFVPVTTTMRLESYNSYQDYLVPPGMGTTMVVGITWGGAYTLTVDINNDFNETQENDNILYFFGPPTATPCPPPPSITPVLTSSPTDTPQSKPTNTATNTPTVIPTGTPTNTPTNAPTDTPIDTATDTPTGIATDIPTDTPTDTPIDTATDTPTGIFTTVPTDTPTDTPTACAIQFTDVPTSHTFYAYIICLACRDILDGYNSNCSTGNPCFRPDNNVTRGQIAKIVSNAAGWSGSIPPDQQSFEDVAPASTFWEYIERMASHNVVQGYHCGGQGEPCGSGNLPYFRPTHSATRGQISKIVVMSAGMPINTSGGPHFSDVANGSTFYNVIETLFNAGAINGYSDGSFRPNDVATRGQTAKIVSNVFFPSCNPTRR